MRFLLPALALTLAGCASVPQPAKFYEGPERPLEQLARVRMPNVRVFVVQVDGQSTKDMATGLLGKSELRLLPGKHEFEVAYTSPNVSQEARGKFSAVVEAGRYYTVRHRVVDSKTVSFSLFDHGDSYDTKCAALRNAVSMTIYLGTEVPAACQ